MEARGRKTNGESKKRCTKGGIREILHEFMSDINEVKTDHNIENCTNQKVKDGDCFVCLCEEDEKEKTTIRSHRKMCGDPAIVKDFTGTMTVSSVFLIMQHFEKFSTHLPPACVFKQLLELHNTRRNVEEKKSD